MRISESLIFCLIMSWACVSARTQPDSSVCDERIIEIIDSIKTIVYNDTTKFSKFDVVQFGTLGLRNNNPYSPIYVVNGSFFYKLDIIPADSVKRLINELFVADKIKCISLTKEDKASALYGIHGERGAILIQLKDEAIYNPLVGGLKFFSMKKGDNYSLHTQ